MSTPRMPAGKIWYTSPVMMSDQAENQDRDNEKGPSRGSAASTARSRKWRSRREFDPDYTYVKQDLRRIALLTGVFLTILVVLSFILR